MAVDDPAAGPFVNDAARKGGIGHTSWAQRVMARIEQAARQYGDSWKSRPVVELVQEAREESLDLGGWPLLVFLRMLRDGEVPADCPIHELSEAARCGAEAEHHLAMFLEWLQLQPAPVPAVLNGRPPTCFEV